jgi:hypothetical protein
VRDDEEFSFAIKAQKEEEAFDGQPKKDEIR